MMFLINDTVLKQQHDEQSQKRYGKNQMNTKQLDIVGSTNKVHEPLCNNESKEDTEDGE